ncbi:hypothetical protein [Bacillus suaedaesalsae]|uniref:Swt1-like HEPN domain-containing protein n=1 Tax=Bacillus suaedaesalsae TaxID=2810349 RepID=A0ABS2DFL1_9BACI|nr:hypothetical protein [Bacillus suaedaesalsae]MBM6617274.1 hypothetical protein [Bacillus suaedaesalsae]
MIVQSEIETMQKAYGELYEVENLLRLYIKEKMQLTYGVHWFYVAPRKEYKRPPKKEFEKLLFHEYEQVYLRAYPEAFKDLNSTFIYQLHSLYPLRNTIAHNHYLDREELSDLLLLSSKLKDVLK